MLRAQEIDAVLSSVCKRLGLCLESSAQERIRKSQLQKADDFAVAILKEAAIDASSVHKDLSVQLVSEISAALREARYVRWRTLGDVARSKLFLLGWLEFVAPFPVHGIYRVYLRSGGEALFTPEQEIVRWVSLCLPAIAALLAMAGHRCSVLLLIACPPIAFVIALPLAPLLDSPILAAVVGGVISGLFCWYAALVVWQDVND